MSKFAILVTCSESRRDIFETCFAHSERIWAECDWPRYVGLTGLGDHEPIYGFKPVTSLRTDWRLATIDYLDALPSEIGYVLLMVEDTLFMRPVDGETLMEQAWWAQAAFAPYLRLVPIRRSPFGRLCHAALRIGDLSGREIIPRSSPYYSSTELALWRRTYLRGLLNYETDAWEFENIVSRTVHWAVTYPIFEQHQIVQKGRWNWDAPRRLRQAGLPPPKPGRRYQSVPSRLRGHWQNLNFALFGFTSLRIKRWLSSVTGA